MKVTFPAFSLVHLNATSFVFSLWKETKLHYINTVKKQYDPEGYKISDEIF